MERKHPLASCESCPLRRESVAKTTGPVDAKIAFVSRSPGKYDAMAGKPFAGPSGKVLDHLLGMYGVKREEILTTNVVLCESSDPPQSAVEACKPRLTEELANVELIITGGVEATTALTRARSISGGRGRAHNRTSARGLPQRVVVTTNPAVVLREANNFPDMIRDFRLALDPVPPVPWKELPQVYAYDTAKEAIEWLEWLNNQKGIIVASDLETFGYTTRVACGGFAVEKDFAHVLDYEMWHHPDVQPYIKRIYENTDIGWLWHNGKYDVKVLRRLGIKARVDHDTFLLSYALDERPGGDYRGDQGAGLHALTPILMEDHGWPDYEHQSVKDFKSTGVLSNPDELYHYNGLDTTGCFWVLDDLTPKAKEDNVYEKPYRRTLIPLANALIPVELRGFNFDVNAAADLNENHVLPKLRELTEEMREISGYALLNPRSPKQVKAIVYDQWGLKHSLQDTRKKVKTGSVDADVRREVIEGRSRCNPGKSEQMLKFMQTYDVFQKIDKQRGTYIEGLIYRVQEDGRLYPTFKFGTVSGRTSSENPNFQNITRSGAHGIPSMRTLFVPSEGCRIVQADYSQAELRTVAKLSGDEALLAIYRDSSRSLHKERATAFYGEGYDKEEYTHAKNMNFGITYGQTAFTFSQQYEIPSDEAQAYIDQWWQDFPDIEKWVTKTHKEALSKGVIVSPFGHKRRFHLITRENKGEVLNEAVNFLPQNIAGLLTEHALIELVNRGVPLVNTVHDSLVADVPVDEVSEVAREMKEVMEQMAIEHLDWSKDDIPFLVDISVGDTWGTVEEIMV